VFELVIGFIIARFFAAPCNSLMWLVDLFTFHTGFEVRYCVRKSYSA